MCVVLQSSPTHQIVCGVFGRRPDYGPNDRLEAMSELACHPVRADAAAAPPIAADTLFLSHSYGSSLSRVSCGLKPRLLIVVRRSSAGEWLRPSSGVAAMAFTRVVKVEQVDLSAQAHPLLVRSCRALSLRPRSRVPAGAALGAAVAARQRCNCLPASLFLACPRAGRVAEQERDHLEPAFGRDLDLLGPERRAERRPQSSRPGSRQPPAIASPARTAR